jgi:uncharacterized protein
MTARRTVSTRQAEDFLRLPRLAVVGASADRAKFGNSVYRALRDQASGSVVAVNRAAGEIEGDRAYATISEIPGGVDGAIVMLPGDAAVAAVQQCIDAGIKDLWLFRGLGGPGAVSAATLELCDRNGVSVVAGACPFMFLPPVKGMHRFHRGVRKARGAVAG